MKSFVNADNSLSFYSAMIDIDQQFGTNYYSTYGSPSVACNCSNSGTGIFPCLWTDGFNGFSCSSDSNSSVSTFIHINLPSASGVIPESLGNITSLTDIQIQFTNISGTLPPSLLSLKNLTILVITNTNLTGSIFSTTSLPSLKILYLNDNQLTGIVPLLSPSVTSLQLQDNQLNGSLSFLEFLPSLSTLTLQNNEFFGSIPASLSNLGLNSLDLSNNFLTGSLPLLNVSFFNCYALNMSLSDCEASSICQVSCRPLCTGTAPENSFCLNDTWVYIGDYVNPNIISLTNSLNIDGNLYLSNSSVIIVGNLSTYAIFVNGSAVLNGTLIIEGKIGETIPILTATNITGTFSNIEINDTCIYPKQERTSTSFSILLTKSSSCDKKSILKILLPSIICGVVVLSIIVFIIFLILYKQGKCKFLFTSFEESDLFR
jgi:hypothetical protein